MYDSTFTFKTIQKHLLLLACLVILINDVASMAMPVSCPEPCECYVNNNGLQSARCSEIYPNQTTFRNIHVLVMHLSKTQDQCYLPKNVHRIFPQLNFVYMMNCSMTYIPVETFKELQFLEEVDLSNNFMKKLDPSVFINNPKLKYANLQNNPFHILDRPFLISKSLRELDISSCGIKELPENMFKNLTNLKYLTLNNNKLTTIEEGTLPNGLKVLSMSKNLIKNVPMVEFVRLKKLREIDISENPVNCTCALMNFESWMSNIPILFLNEVECSYPREYRGRKLSKMPEYKLCDAKVAAMTDADLDTLQLNQILPDEEPVKKKDNVKDDFEIDQVVPFDKKSNADYDNEMQSDSAIDEGSGDGTDIPESQTDIPDDEVTPKSKVIPSNNESNEAKPDNATTVVPNSKPEQPASSAEPVTENKYTVSNTDGNTNLSTADSATSSIPVDKPEKKPEETKPSTEPPNTTPEQHQVATSEIPKSSEPTIPTSKPKPIDAEPKVSDPELSKTTPDSVTTTPEPQTDKSEQKVIPPGPNENFESAAPSAVNHPEVSQHLPSQSSQSTSEIFSMGYIIPCLAILIVIIICLGIYLGQRSSHKHWEPTNANVNDGGAELQDVSLLPDKSKPPIVKNKKYPSEGNSEQTERLMNNGEASEPRSVWEHLEEPIENGNTKYSKDSDKLPNGQPIDKNEPIECAIVKVTTLPDSIPRTPLIRNT